MNKSKLLTRLMLFGLLLALSPQLATAQGAPEKATIVKDVDRKQQMERYQKTVDAIEQNQGYTRAEKDSLIKLQRNELKQILKGKKKGRKYGTRGKEGRANGLAKEELKAKREAAKAEYQRSLEEIDSNTKLTAAQKEEAKAALKAEYNDKNARIKGPRGKMNSHGNGQGGRAKGDKKGPGAGKSLNKEQRKAHKAAAKAEHKRRLELIDANTELSQEEKQAAKAALKAERSEHRRAKRGHLRREGKGRQAAKQLSKVESKAAKTDLTAEQKEAAILRLNKLNKDLDKQKKRGKISEENYLQRKGEIDDLLIKLK